MIDPEYITSAQAAEQLGYTIQHVRRLIGQGRLAGFKLGRDWVVSRTSVEAMAVKGELLDLPFSQNR